MDYRPESNLGLPRYPQQLGPPPLEQQPATEPIMHYVELLMYALCSSPLIWVYRRASHYISTTATRERATRERGYLRAKDARSKKGRDEDSQHQCF